MRVQRSGFTFPELMTAMAVMALLFLLVGPKLGVMRDGSAVRGGKRRVASMLVTAKQSAISQGRMTRFRLQGDTVMVLAAKNGSFTDTLVRPVDVRATDHASVEAIVAADSVVDFDPRGLAFGGGGGALRRYVVASGAKSDTICVFGSAIQGTRCTQ